MFASASAGSANQRRACIFWPPTCEAGVLGRASPGTPIASYSYTLGPAGNRLSVQELSGRTVQYGYDDLYRLTSETIAGSATQNGTVSYQYDAVGNRKQLNSTLPAVPTGLLNYDANDRIATQVYDNNGNTVNNGIQNVYDFENRLVQRGEHSDRLRRRRQPRPGERRGNKHLLPGRGDQSHRLRPGAGRAPEHAVEQRQQSLRLGPATGRHGRREQVPIRRSVTAALLRL